MTYIRQPSHRLKKQKINVRPSSPIRSSYINTSVLLENAPLVKFIRSYIQDLSDVFSISSIVKISMILLISSLSLKLYLNSLVYDRNIFGSSSKVIGNLLKSSEICKKCSRTFNWPSEEF